MTQDEIIEMARQAGLDPDLWNYTDAFEAFAKLVEERTAAKERERFAHECIDLVASYGGPIDLEAAIRARGEQ